jgi:N-acetylmuramoyl-L-alanine amidase
LIRSFRRILGPKRVFALGLILGLGLLFWPARTLRSDNFVFYFPDSRHIVSLEEIGQAQYLPLMPVLNVIGKVGALQEKRNSLTVWFGKVEIVLRAGDKAIRVGKTGVSLAHPVRIVNGQWMVPVDFVTTALPHLTVEPIEYQVGANRVFIGDVKPVSFSLRLDPVPNGARITVQFTDKVNLTTASSNGKWYLFLGNRPVEPLESSFRFPDSYVNNVQFDDQDGQPKLVITPASGGLNFYPTVAEGGKVVVADILKPPPSEPQQAATPQAPEAGAVPATVTPPGQAAEELPMAPAGATLPVVVLDAGHGGANLGARSRDAVLEKDLVAQLVARVRLAVLASGKYRVVLTRVGDVSMGFEQRAVAANLARPLAFLTFHAGNLGITSPRVMVYSYQPSSPPPPDQAPPGLFVPWAKVQLPHLGRSRELALALHQQFAQIPGITADRPADAPVRTLRSIDAPAAAIEIGSLSIDEDAAVLTTPNFQNQVAAAILNALEAFRGGHT